MDTTATGAIIVGVTGPKREEAALAFAAEVAAREGREVLLVHAFRPELPPPPASILMSYDEPPDIAHRLVAQVGDEFEKMTNGSVPFRTLARPGSSASVVVELSEGARMVVLQHRDSHVLGRLFVGSTVNGAAAHAHCPAVSVNSGWAPGSSGEVVVGLHEHGGPVEVLTAGLEWAAATGTTVRAVHAWRLEATYDHIITPGVAEEWSAQQRDALEQDLRKARPDGWDVPVEVDVRYEWPTQVLVELSGTASLTVLGRHGHLGWLPERLGSVARTVLREARGPVMVVPVRREQEVAEDDWGLVADEVSPQT